MVATRVSLTRMHHPTAIPPPATFPHSHDHLARNERLVHALHARKMAARMLSQGHPVLYYENVEGGHGAGVTPEQRAKMTAVRYTYLWTQLAEGTAVP